MKTVLIIDDEADLRMLLALAFKAHGFGIREFSSATDALHYLREAASEPDIILLDLNMPGLPAAEFILKIRADSLLRDVKVILSSGCEDIGRAAEKVGADGFLGKPFGLEEIESLVREVSDRPARNQIELGPLELAQ